MPKTLAEQTRRRKQILNILNDNHVRVENLDQLLAYLEERGIEASKSSVSRDLKDLSIIRVTAATRSRPGTGTTRRCTGWTTSSRRWSPAAPIRP